MGILDTDLAHTLPYEFIVLRHEQKIRLEELIQAHSAHLNARGNKLLNHSLFTMLLDLQDNRALRVAKMGYFQHKRTVSDLKKQLRP